MTKTNIAIGAAVALLLLTIFLAFSLQKTEEERTLLESKLSAANIQIDSMYSQEVVIEAMKQSCIETYQSALNQAWETACELQGKGRDCEYLPTNIAQPLNDTSDKGNVYCAI